MAPELIDADPDRSADLQQTRESAQFFAEHMEELKQEYGGQYVIVHDQDVVAASKRAEEAWDKLEGTGIDPSDCVMQYVPEPGRAFFF